ncbi:MAG: electron transfer flavoprotein subunit alpha/FixB family protein [Anaerohalosphaera sp.]|nr:electron transfer flavoprotein subunit alpha/FixB family protein [Anaerohalosphaera sp.]
MANSGVWILAEQKDGVVQSVSFELLTRGIDLASQRNCKLSAMIIGDQIQQAGLQELIDRGADQVVCLEGAGLKHFLPEPYSSCMTMLIEEHKPEIVIAGATTIGRTLMPYVAIKVTAGLTADCTELSIEKGTGNLLQTRPAIGGNIMATIKTPNHRPQMATVRPRSTMPAPLQCGRTGQIVRINAEQNLLHSKIVYESFIANEDKVSLADAETIIAVGRGIKKAENLPLIYQLADLLGAAVGATRDVVDRGWLSYPHQIGLSGQTVNPKLYIGIGLSGTIQHLAGMQTAENIIAVNSDPEAQIFKVADFGIVGDLFEVVPKMIERLKAGESL